MKGKKKVIIPIAVIAVIVVAAVAGLNVLTSNGTLNMADVYSTIQKLLPYFIPFILVVAAGIAVRIIFSGKTENIKFMIGKQGLLAGFLALVITVNVVLFGPMQSVLNLALNAPAVLSEETKASDKDLNIKIAEEGSVLLKNENHVLPLGTDTKKLNVFGWASTNPCYGGTGSGSVDTKTCTGVLTSLKDAGYSLNTELSDFYKAYRADRPEVGMWSQDWTLPEPSVDKYSSKMISDAKNFSDYAMIVITRVGGEGADLPTDMSKVTYKGNQGDFKQGQTYLELSNSEKEMVKMVTSNFSHVVVLINSANAMQLGWVNEYPSIQGVLWMAGAGQNGFAALGEILDGKTDPSGKLPDTYVYDLTSTPTFHNIGNFQYKNMDKYAYSSVDFMTKKNVTTIPSFVNYAEGIYVGYRFYETYYLNDDAGYQAAVQYPFGYGLSYTSFSQKMGELQKKSDGTVSFDVTVTNTGSVSGKDVVEAYYTAPYTEGGIEKSAVDLLDFAKTKELKPGESQKVTITLKQEDMASFDTYGEKCYVLDPGDYQISIRSNSHTVLDSKTYQVPQKVVYNESNKRSTDQVTAVDQLKDITEGNVTYLSRAGHFANYKEATAAPKDFSMSDAALKDFYNVTNYVPTEDKTASMPVTGARNGVKLNDLAGKKYDDPQWDKLLDELSVEDMTKLVSLGGYQTYGVSSVKKLATIDADGPAGYSSFFSKLAGTPFPCATMIAATWNKDLAQARGVAMGTEGNELGVSGWYGPAMNIHRSAFAGRNFEYYSEDGVLAGKMAAHEIAGAASKGVYAYMKHFALNDQETNRCNMLCTWAAEQAVRQIYLKPFELSVKEGNCTAVMSSFNYIGTEWAGGCKALLENILRKEWGFQGMVLTDYFGGYGYMDADRAIRNGNDCMLSTTGESGATPDDVKSATAVSAMRSASHDIMYTVVNSHAYADYSDGIKLQNWMKPVIGVDIVLAALFLFLEGWTITVFRKKSK